MLERSEKLSSWCFGRARASLLKVLKFSLKRFHMISIWYISEQFQQSENLTKSVWYIKWFGFWAPVFRCWLFSTKINAILDAYSEFCLTCANSIASFVLPWIHFPSFNIKYLLQLICVLSVKRLTLRVKCTKVFWFDLDLNALLR
jgi:hypothetical protein